MEKEISADELYVLKRVKQEPNKVTGYIMYKCTVIFREHMMTWL